MLCRNIVARAGRSLCSALMISIPTVAFAQTTDQCDRAAPDCTPPTLILAQNSADGQGVRSTPRVKMDRKKKPRTIYDSYGANVYARGGALFAGHTGNGDLDVLGATATAGYRHRVLAKKRLSLFIQPEAVYFRDVTRETIVGQQVETTFSGIGAILSLGAHYPIGPVGVFGSVGAGPLEVQTDINDGFTDLETSYMAVGYSAVVGLETQLLDQLYFETAWRYLGAVREDVIGLNSLEFGVNYKF